MASLKSMHVFLPLSIGFFLCLHVVAAHRKLNINKRLLMSSSTFYNAFDHKNTNTFDANHNTFSPSANKDGTNANSENNANRYSDIADSEFSNANSENNANRYSDIADSEFSTKPYTNSHSYNALNPNRFASSYSKNANLPLSTSNTHQANGVQHSFPNTNEFSSPSSSSTYGGKFPNSYEGSLPDARNEYNKQSFPSNDQPGMHGSHDAKSLFYGSPSREQALSQSPSNYQTTSYNPFYHFDEPKKGDNYVSDVAYKNEKPVTNYDKFFNTPTIHKNEVEGSATSSPFGRPQFPVSDHDLTYGHVQVP
ncbi:hypothetical protein L7F22_049266 [Adiantum nelumboides]|nr:hypothetical protein [Adiantum nelumboides]